MRFAYHDGIKDIWLTTFKDAAPSFIISLEGDKISLSDSKLDSWTPLNYLSLSYLMC